MNATNRISGQEKQEVYAELKRRLSLAIRNEFWFEACMIEYAIVEDRTSSILDKCEICKDAYSSSKMLSNKLNSITNQIEMGHPIISNKVSHETINRINVWREKRNDVVHRACVRSYSEVEIQEVAIEGKELVRLISNDSGKVTRAAAKEKSGA